MLLFFFGGGTQFNESRKISAWRYLSFTIIEKDSPILSYMHKNHKKYE